MTGSIKWWDDAKGFGFVRGADGRDFFLFHSNLIDEMQSRHWIQRGDLCEFDIGERKQGAPNDRRAPLALNVRVAEPGTRTWRAPSQQARQS